MSCSHEVSVYKVETWLLRLRSSHKLNAEEALVLLGGGSTLHNLQPSNLALEDLLRVTLQILLAVGVTLTFLILFHFFSLFYGGNLEEIRG